jgi:hypothetical protein
MIVEPSVLTGSFQIFFVTRQNVSRTMIDEMIQANDPRVAWAAISLPNTCEVAAG